MKTLILVNSKYGSAEKCAKLIMKDLEGTVDIINLKNKECKDIDSYDNVIIGGSVYAGRMGEEIKKIVENNKESLCRKNVGLFICCKEEGEKAQEFMKANIPQWLIERAFINEHLGHEINLEKMNFLERFLLKGIFKVKESYSMIDYDALKRLIEKINRMDVVNG